jgi:hypothetical protein
MNKEMLESLTRVSASIIRETPLPDPMKDACINLVGCIASEIGRRAEATPEDGAPTCEQPGRAPGEAASDLFEAIRSAVEGGPRDVPADPVRAALSTLREVELRVASNIRSVVDQAERLGADAQTLQDMLGRYAHMLGLIEKETALDIFESIRPRFARQDPSEAA